MNTTLKTVGLVGRLAAVLVAAALMLGTVRAEAATPPERPFTTAVAQTSAVDAAVMAKHAVQQQAGKPAANSMYGCVGLLNAKQWQVIAFAVGYCPTVWVLQYTPWGRAVVNWIVNGLCRVPWVVRAATGGRYSSC